MAQFYRDMIGSFARQREPHKSLYDPWHVEENI
jgi:hypothetical protein